jgi:alkanesulfonate monooxygenase
MTDKLRALGIRVFTTCPPSHAVYRHAYVKEVVRVAKWSERAGCEGVLVYSDNSMVDPWLVAQTVIANTDSLAPLVAVQPVYAHPYTVAKLVASLAVMHERRVYLNMVAGGFKNDLNALNDPTPHDERYMRLAEYTQVILSLLTANGPVTLDGRYYRVTNLRMNPPIGSSLVPGVFVSGSSPAGIAAAEQLGALAVRYPKPADEYEEPNAKSATAFGIRVGIIARERSGDAWKAAHTRFPGDRQGQLTHQLAMKISDSAWHRQLSDLARRPGAPEEPYWMFPFENYKTFCPYLVGSYERVADELARYVRIGCRTIILDVPPSEKELQHTHVALNRAAERTLL